MDDNAGFDQDGNGPGVKFPPPLVFVLAIGFAHLVNKVLPMGFADKAVLKAFGAFVMAAGFILLACAFIQFKRAKTDIEPWKASSSLIESGLFSRSRNPVYLCFCVITIGLGFYWNNFWILLSFLPALYLVFRIAVQPEERYLEKKFGAQYRDYQRRVRRWL
jgi:protein-S-isoprenylcysteine O-methyltransferase Ste14